MPGVRRALQFVLEILVAVLVAGIFNALLLPLLRYLDRMPAYPWNAALVFGVLLGLAAVATLRPGGSLRRN